MTIERSIRLIAGIFVSLSVVLSYLWSPYWLFFTLFVGLNLFQSSLSGFCPMETLLRRLGIGAHSIGERPRPEPGREDQWAGWSG